MKKQPPRDKKKSTDKENLSKPGYEKELKSVQSGLFSRTFSLAKMTLKAGSSYAGQVLQNRNLNSDSDDFKNFMVSQALMLNRELGKLKGTALKAGQMLSVYGEHFLPPEATMILKALQSKSLPVKWSSIKESLVATLGSRLEELEVEERALASASLGQVHKAKIKSSGETMVLKVQYPGVSKAIDSDLRALRGILSVTKLLPADLDTRPIFDEIRSMLHQEVDYEHEKQLTEKFYQKLTGDSRYVVPKIFERYCTKTTLATTLEVGLRVDDPIVANLPQERRNQLAASILDLYFRELFVWMMVQTDPHPGNYAIKLSPEGRDQWILYDFGASRIYSEEFVSAYSKMISASLHNNESQFRTAALSLGFIKRTDSEELILLFTALCSDIIEPYMAADDPRALGRIDSEGRYNFGKSDLPQRILQRALALKKVLSLRTPPRENIFLDRKTVGMFTILSILKANFNCREVLLPYLDNSHIAKLREQE